MAQRLSMAMKLQDLELLVSTLSHVDPSCVEMPNVQQARRILSASEALQVAIDSGDVATIKQVVGDVEGDCILCEMAIMKRALSILHAVDALQAAIEGEDASAFQDAIRAAE